MEKKQLVYILLIWCLVIAMSSCNPDVSDRSKVYQINDGCNEGRYHVYVTSKDGNAKICTDNKYEIGDLVLPKQNIDVPEEFNQISTDSTKPDTLVCWRSADGVSHVQFK